MVEVRGCKYAAECPSFLIYTIIFSMFEEDKNQGVLWDGKDQKKAVVV